MIHRWMAVGVVLGTVLIAFSANAQSASPAFNNTLLPQPAHLSVNSGSLPLTPQFTATADKFHDGRLDGAIGHMLVRLKMQTGAQIATTSGSAPATLMVSVDGPGEAIQGPDENEAYSLEITSNGARLKAATVVGAIHGLETFLQLVQNDGSNYFLPAVSIDDAPRFRWRG
ncbi:MAG TPA: glycoside hydrolase family 20 zincin-like fold domain-containing protein, partial [Silvibacterium sp.]|nr:glycoside hydrolase family 20 zincin-like fold domain-containing protein [Silvibacterium sp.]